MMTDEYHNSHAVDLPHGWVWTTIGEITQPVEKVDPTQRPDEEFTYLDISSIDNTTHVIREPKIYYGANAPSRARQLVRGGDVLFSTVRTYLKNIAEVPEVYDRQIASTGFSVLRGKEGISSKYLFYYSLTSGFLSTLAELQRGTSYPAVRDGDVRDQPIPLAPTAEQHRIVAKIEELFTRLDAGVAALKRMQANLKRYKAAVLKAACEGKLVPQDPNDEPASKLLEQIREKRRQKYIADEIATLELVLHSRIRSSDVHYTPEEVIRDWLIEVVLDTIDRSPQTALLDLKYPLVVNTILSRFFKSVHEVIEHRVRQRNYLEWLDDSLRLLIAESAPSEVLLKQAQAWAQYVQEKVTPGRPIDTISMIFGASDSKFSAVRRGMEARSIRESGVDYIRREYIEKPAVDKWLKDEARRKSPNVANLPELLKGWCWATVEQLNPADRSCAYGVLQPGSDFEDGVVLVRVGDIDDGRIHLQNLKRIDPAIAAQYPRVKLMGSEVLITLVGAIGRTAVVPPALAGAVTARAVGVIPLTEQVDPCWVEIWFRNPEKVAEMTSKAHEVARKTLNLEDVRVALVAIPPLAEQCRIVAEVERRLSVVQEMEAAVTANLARSERLRQSILRRAFEGKLVPQDPADEPAAVLVERIKAAKVQATRAPVCAMKNRRGRRK